MDDAAAVNPTQPLQQLAPNELGAGAFQEHRRSALPPVGDQAMQRLPAMLENRPHHIGINEDIQKGHHARMSSTLRNHDLPEGVVQDICPGIMSLEI